MSKDVRVLQTFAAQTDGHLIATTVAVTKGVKDRPEFTNLPVDPNALQKTVDELIAAIPAQSTGWTAATSLTNDKRAELIACCVSSRIASRITAAVIRRNSASTRSPLAPRRYKVQVAAVDADGKPGPWQPGGTYWWTTLQCGRERSLAEMAMAHSHKPQYSTLQCGRAMRIAA